MATKGWSKRLNKRVLFLGILFVLFVLGGIIVLRSGRFVHWFHSDPQPFVDTAREQIQRKNYRAADRSFGLAYQIASSQKDHEAMIQILFEMAEFHKTHDVDADVESPSYHPAAWDKTLGCWNKIVTLDPKNVLARQKLLNYFYEVSDSRSGNAWKLVETNADELIQLYRGKNEPVDPLLFLYLGQSRLMQAELGDSPDREAICQNAIGILRDAQKDLPKNFKVYQLLAQAYRLKGELGNLRGDTTARATAIGEVETILKEAVSQITETPEARIAEMEFRLEKTAPERKPEDPRLKKQAYQLIGQLLADHDLDLTKDLETLVKDFKETSKVQKFLEDAYNTLEKQNTGKDTQTREKARESFNSKFDSSIRRALFHSKIKMEMDVLAADFKDNPEVLAFRSRLFQLIQEQDKAIEAIEKAHELDKTKYDYALQAAILYYRQIGFLSDPAESVLWLDKAIGIATDALSYPEAQVVPGPQEGIQNSRRLNLYNYLASWQIEKYRLDKDPQTFDKAKKIIDQIQQFLKTSDNIYMGKWRGMLDLAKGRVEQEAALSEDDPKLRANLLLKADKQISNAIGTLYTAQQQLVTLKQNDPLLSYTLASAFRGRPEFGARAKFLSQSFGPSNNSIVTLKPNAYLEYAEMMLELENGPTAVQAVDLFEASFPATPRSRDLRFEALMMAAQTESDFDQIEEELESLDIPADRLSIFRAQLIHRRIKAIHSTLTRVNETLNSNNLTLELLNQTMKSSESLDMDSLKRSIADLQTRQKDLVKQQENLKARIAELVPRRQSIIIAMMEKDPKSTDPKILMDVCRDLAKNNQAEKAKQLVADYIQAMPRYVPIRSFEKTLATPPDTELSQEQIQQNAILSIREALPDKKVEQAVEIARVLLALPASDAAWRIRNRNAAYAELTSVLETAGDNPQVIELLFDLSLIPDSAQSDAKPDLEMARKYAQKAKELDIDKCGGLFFQARLDMVDLQFTSAVEKLTECIRILPIFPQAFYYRSMAQRALGNLTEAAKDADQAFDWTFVDGNIAKLRATIYYQLFRKAGTNPTPEDYNRMNEAMFTAIRLNPENLELLNFYAELISDREPDRALALRQKILSASPSAEHGRLLGVLALRLYDTYETNRVVQKIGTKDYLLLVAQKALEKARELAPSDPAVLNAWGEYLRISGKQILAEKTLPPDSLSMVDFYINDGKYAKAKEILEKLYEKGPKSNPAVLRGLVVVALKTGDSSGLDQYTRELMEVKFEDPKSKEATEMWALQKLLEFNFEPDKTALRIASFRERYPANIEGLVMQAWSDFNRYAFDAAWTHVGEILTQKPNHAIAWRIRGVLNRIKSDLPQAISDLQKSLSFTDDPITRMELAQSYIITGQKTSAISELVTALEKPQAPDRVRYLLESIYTDSGRTEDLQKFYDQTVSKFPDDWYWLHRAGGFLLTQYQKRLDQEKNDARKQGKWKPGTLFKPSDKTLELLDKAAPLLEKSWNLAEPQWKLHPDQVVYAKILDYYLESLLQKLETPTQLTQFIRISSKYADTPLAPVAFSQMAQANLRMGDRTKGLELFDRALESAKNQPEFVVQLLDVMQKVLESNKEVRAWCEKTLAADPKHIGANYTMFQLAQAADQFNVALEFLDRCLTQLEAEIKTLQAEQNAAKNAGTENTDQSANRRQRLAHLQNNWVEYTLQKSQVLLKAFFKSGDKKYLDGGVALYESILKAAPPNHPKRALVLNNLAYLLADNNQDLEKAVGYARQALKETPTDPVRMDTLSYTLSKSRQFEEAEKMALMSIQYHELAGNSVPWDSYFHLGMAQEGLGKKSEALTSYQKSLDAGGDSIPASDKEQIAAAIKRVSP